MRLFAIAVALALHASAEMPSEKERPLRDYVTGESAEKPDLAGWSWEDARKALLAGGREAAEKPGEELVHVHTLPDGYQSAIFYYVPKSYDASKPSPLVLWLHGAVSSDKPERGKGQWSVWKEEADRQGWILCAPSGSARTLWWKAAGEDHVLEAVRHVSARYAVDRNRVLVTGFSDGASGAWSLGARYADAWAGCMPMNGSIGVVARRDTGGFPYDALNARGTSWYATHGDEDVLYPTKAMAPAMEVLRKAGVALEWRTFEGVGHRKDLVLERDRERMGAWIEARRREPLPGTVDWVVRDAARYGRAFWVRVLEVAETQGDPFAGEEDFAIPMGDDGPPRPMLGIAIDRGFGGPGVRLDAVSPGMGAEKAGLQKGDVILSMDGEDLTTAMAFVEALVAKKAGDTIRLTVTRGEKRFDADVTLTVPAPAQPAAPAGPAGRVRAVRRGNAVEVKARNVARLEILVSPDAFDLGREIVVTVNGEEKFRGRVEASAETLVEEARSRLGDLSVRFAARIRLDLRK